jgi:hypothetical protein
MRKKALLISLMLGFAVFFSAVCPQLCSSDLLGLDSMQHGNCTLSSQSFGYTGTDLLTLFLLPMIGLFPSNNFTFTPGDFVLSCFRPPRFQS